MQEEDPYRREPALAAERGALQLGDEPLQFRTNRSERNSGPVGRGGWLIAVAIMMVWSLLFSVGNAGSTAALLADPRLEAGMRGALQVHVVVAGALFVFNLVALVLFFMKSAWFPRVYVAWLGSDLIAVAVTSGLLAQSRDASAFIGMFAIVVIVRTLFWNGLWMAYAIMSDRVKNTFVAHRP